MMQLYKNERIDTLLNFYKEIDNEIDNFTQKTNLHCIEGCGNCCNVDHSNIEASVFEFFPLAFELWQNNKADELLSHLSENKPNICVLFRGDKNNPVKGYCSDYKNRGLICRLFGFSTLTNKYDKSEIVTCKFIKERYNTVIQAYNQQNKNNLLLPAMYKARADLNSISPHHTQELFPINMAIEKALVYIGFKISLLNS